MSERDREMQAEALRCASGILAAKNRQAPDDATLLLQAYMGVARERRVKETQAWFYLFGAAIHWANQLAKETAGERHVEVEQVLQEIGTAALSWPTS